jgi:hypothetical protein
MAKSQLRSNKEKKKPKQVKPKGNAPVSPFLAPTGKSTGSADGKK